MKFKVILCVLTLALYTSACFGPSEEQKAQQSQKDAELKRKAGEMIKAHQEWKEQHKDALRPLPVTTLTPQTPARATEPKIGMTFDDFKFLCGPPSPLTDDLRTRETSYGYISAYFYEYSEGRGAKRCWGMFTFRDSKLVSISR